MNNEIGTTSVARAEAQPPGALPLEPQPRESDKVFAAFKVDMKLGPEYSLALAADKLGKSATLMERWSRKFDWPARVQAHSAHLADIERKTAGALAVQAGTLLAL